MNRLDFFPQKDDVNFSKMLRIVIIAIIVFILLLILIAAGQFIFLSQIFHWIQRIVRSQTGFDMPIVNCLTFVIMALIFSLPIWKLLKSFLPLPQKQKKIYRGAVFICIAILCLASYFCSQQVFFDSGTGRSLKYYSIDPNGQYKFYSAAGFDPLTGDTLKQVTRDIILKYLHPVKRELPPPKSNPLNYVANQPVKPIASNYVPPRQIQTSQPDHYQARQIAQAKQIGVRQPQTIEPQFGGTRPLFKPDKILYPGDNKIFKAAGEEGDWFKLPAGNYSYSISLRIDDQIMFIDEMVYHRIQDIDFEHMRYVSFKIKLAIDGVINIVITKKPIQYQSQQRYVSDDETKVYNHHTHRSSSYQTNFNTNSSPYYQTGVNPNLPSYQPTYNHR